MLSGLPCQWIQISSVRLFQRSPLGSLSKTAHSLSHVVEKTSSSAFTTCLGVRWKGEFIIPFFFLEAFHSSFWVLLDRLWSSPAHQPHAWPVPRSDTLLGVTMLIYSRTPCQGFKELFVFPTKGHKLHPAKVKSIKTPSELTLPRVLMFWRGTLIILTL